MTWVGTNVRVYLNGLLLCSSSAFTGGVNLTSGQKLTLGQSSSHIFWQYNGLMDEFAFYGTALTGARIAAHYKAVPLKSYQAAVMADSPLGYWRLGDGSGTTMADSSGNSRNGTYTGSPSFGVGGLLVGDTDTAVSLNGSSQYGNVSVALLPNPTTAISVEALIQPSGGAGTYRSFIARDFVGTNGPFRLRINNANKLEWLVWHSGITVLTSATSIVVGTTYHVVATYDGANMNLYINGLLDATVAATGALNTASEDFWVGKYQAGELFPGVIDEVSYYHTALSATRVAAHFNASQAHLEATPLFVSKTQATVFGTSVTKPSGVAAGDHLMIITGVSNQTPVTITGFTRIMSPHMINAGSSQGDINVLYRKLDGSEGSTFTLPYSANWVAIAYRGGAGMPALIGSMWPSDRTPTSLISRYRAPTDGTVIHVFAQALSGVTTFTAPSGVNNRANCAVDYMAIDVCDEVVAAGDDNARTATYVGGIGGSTALTLMIPTSQGIPSAILPVVANAVSANATITIPSDAAIGDLFICAFEVTANTVTAGPAGFTAFDGPGNNSGGTYNNGYWWGYKVLASGDPGSTIHITNGSQIWGFCRYCDSKPQRNSGRCFRNRCTWYD